MASENLSTLLSLPIEIRLQILSLLVLPLEPNDLLPSFARVSSSAPESFNYEVRQHGTDRPVRANLSRPTLVMRTIEGSYYLQQMRVKGPHKRSSYSVRSDRFRARLMNTSYHCVNVPNLQSHLGIMAVNRQIHAEAAELLYSSYTFDFDTHIEAIVPFLKDLTPLARSHVRSIRFVKRALPYDKEFDRAEWAAALKYLTSEGSDMNLRRLELGVVAGRPGVNGWEDVQQYAPRDFALLKDQEGMEWLRYLLGLKGLTELDVQAVVEHCPSASISAAMMAYVRFSASVGSGLADFLREELLP